MSTKMQKCCPKKEKKEKIKSVERGQNMTVIAFMNVTSTFIPPLLIFKPQK